MWKKWTIRLYCRKGHLNVKETSLFFYQLINGIESLHNKGISHRNLKPESILLTSLDLTLKICNFSFIHKNNEVEEMLKTKCGSPSYVSPEIISFPFYDDKNDIWEWGNILYTMLYGFLPFEGENNDLLYKNIVKCKFEIPDQLSESSKDLLKK